MERLFKSVKIKFFQMQPLFHFGSHYEFITLFYTLDKSDIDLAYLKQSLESANLKEQVKILNEYLIFRPTFIDQVV